MNKKKKEGNNKTIIWLAIIAIIIIIMLFFFFYCNRKVDNNTNVTTISQENRKEAPDFTLSTLDGGVIQLSNFRGKVVLIDFWAEWCGPCKTATPSIISLYNKFKDKDLRVFGINLDDKSDLDKVVKYVKDKKIEYPILIEGFPAASKYGVSGIPRFVLIDKNGKIAFELIGAVENLENILTVNIESLLKE